MNAQKFIRLTGLLTVIIASVLIGFSNVGAQTANRDENTDLWRVRGMAAPFGLPNAGTWHGDSLWVGATFMRDTTKPLIVWLADYYVPQGSYHGALYLMVPRPGLPDSAYFLFWNKCQLNQNAPTRIDLTALTPTIHHLDTLFFMYRSSQTGASGTSCRGNYPTLTTDMGVRQDDSLFTGPNRAPGEGWLNIDRHYSARNTKDLTNSPISTNFFSLSKGDSVPYGRRWCEAAWVHTVPSGNVRTDTVEFGFEDQFNGADINYEDIRFNVSGVFLIHRVILDTLMLNFYPVRDTIAIGDSIAFHTVLMGTDSLGKPFSDSTILAKNITWQLLKSPSSQNILTGGNGPSNVNTFKALTGGEKDTMIVSYTDPKTGATLQTRQVVFIKAIAPPITDVGVTATVLDTNHNGHIDRIDLTWTGSDTIVTPLPSVSDLIKSLTLVTLDGNKINLSAAKFVYDQNGKTIHIIIDETPGSTYETGVNTTTSQFLLTNVPMTTGGRPFIITAIVDGAAPVIKAVCFVPANNADTLRVTFSEPVTAANKPGDPKTDYFSFINTLDNSKHSSSEFLVTTVSQSDRILYLYQPSKILSNALLVSEGSRAPIPLVTCGDVSIVSEYHVASNPFKPGETTIPQSQQDLSRPNVPYGTRIEVTFIKAVTKNIVDGSISGSLVIFDAVGNTVFKSSDMSKETNKAAPKLFWNWDGKTDKGITAGAGTYVVRIQILEHLTGKTTTIRQVIGVKK